MDTIFELFDKISLGSSSGGYNPGSITVVANLYKEDPMNLHILQTWYEKHQALEHPLQDLPNFSEIPKRVAERVDLKQNWWLWCLYKDICHEDLEELLRVIRTAIHSDVDS